MMRNLLTLLLLFALPAWGQVGSRNFNPDDDANGDKIDFGTTVSGLVTGDWTFAAWLIADERTEVSGVAGNREQSGQFDGWYIYIMGNGSNSALVCATTVGGSTGYYWGQTDLRNTGWKFITCRKTGSALEAYVNAILETENDAGADVSGDPSTAVTTYIGQGDALCQTSNNRCFDGKMAYAHLYNRSLSVSEIQRIRDCPGSVTKSLIGYWPLTDSTTQYDRSGGGYNGTLDGTDNLTDGPPVSTNCALAGGN